MSKEEKRELVAFLVGKTITGVRMDVEEGPATGFDLIFSDGSELELYAVSTDATLGAVAWVQLTPEEAEEQRAENAELDRLEGEIAAGRARVFGNDEVWGEGEDEPDSSDS